MKEISVFTCSRADYGLLMNLMKMLNTSTKYKLTVIVAGSHLSQKFGLTVNEITRDGFEISSKINSIQEIDSELSVAEGMARIIPECYTALVQMNPDLLIILGDRYETLSAAISATLANKPIAHIHGGEVTSGSMDNVFRNSITKMSQIHFAATELSKTRIVEMGENERFVFQVGGLGVDRINKLEKSTKEELESTYGIKLQDKNLLVTFHPDSLHPKESKNQFEQLLIALNKLENTGLIFTAPNADEGSTTLIELIEEFLKANPAGSLIRSLGFRDYISLASLMDGVIGNSSSGILEIPTLKIGTINIGSRQAGREMSSSVINCESLEQDISNAIQTLYSSDFQNLLKFSTNPYGLGGAAEAIIDVLDGLDWERLN